MNSSWRAEILAMLRKEWLSEQRSRSAAMTVGLLSVATVVALAFATYGFKLQGSIGAGLLWVGLLFAAIASLPRSFLSEEETGTADLLRQWARPHAVFWGKALFNLGQMLATALLLSTLFLVLTSLVVTAWPLYLVSLLFGAAALAGAVTLCAALVARAANRAALVGAISVPLLLPLIALGVGAVRVALGDGSAEGGWAACVGLGFYGMAIGAFGPYLFAAIWKS